MKSYSAAHEFVGPKVNIWRDIRCGSLQKELRLVCVAYPLGSGNLWEDRWSSTHCSPGSTDPKCQWTLSRSSTRPGKKKTRCVWNHMFAGILDTDSESSVLLRVMTCICGLLWATGQRSHGGMNIRLSLWRFEGFAQVCSAPRISDIYVSLACSLHFECAHKNALGGTRWRHGGRDHVSVT